MPGERKEGHAGAQVLSQNQCPQPLYSFKIFTSDHTGSILMPNTLTKMKSKKERGMKLWSDS